MTGASTSWDRAFLSYRSLDDDGLPELNHGGPPRRAAGSEAPECAPGRHRSVFVCRSASQHSSTACARSGPTAAAPARGACWPQTARRRRARQGPARSSPAACRMRAAWSLRIWLPTAPSMAMGSARSLSMMLRRSSARSNSRWPSASVISKTTASSVGSTSASMSARTMSSAPE